MTNPMSLAAPPLPHLGRKVIAAVAQQAFEASGNIFCKLLPVLFADGSRITGETSSEFPSHGLILWKLRDGDRPLAEPGRLLTVTCATSDKAGGEGMEWYQVGGPALDAAAAGLAEILDAPRLRVAEPEDLTAGYRHRSDHPPSPILWVRADGSLWGPFTPTKPDVDPDGRYQFGLDVYLPNSLRRIPVDDAEATRLGMPWQVAAVVSLNTQPPHTARAATRRCSYLLARSDLLNDDPGAETLRVEPPGEFLVRVARELQKAGELSRRQRQELGQSLTEIGELARRSGRPDLPDVETAIARLRHAVAADADAAERLVAAVLDSRLFAARVDAAVAARVAERADQIEEAARREASDAVGHVGQEIEAARARLAEVHAAGEVASRELAGVREEAARLREQAERTLSESRRRSERERAELEADRRRYEEFVSRTVDRWRDGRDALLRDFAALQPLVESVTSRPAGRPPATDERAAPAVPAVPEVPAAKTGPPFDDPKAFIERRLWPLLADWDPAATKRGATLFHFGLLACRLLVVPDASWAAAYAEAAGASLALRPVEPDWLAFRQAWEGGCASAWAAAAARPDELHLVCFDGADRSPTSAWLGPLFAAAAEIGGPGAGGVTAWPPNLRVLLTLDRSDSCFPVPETLNRYAGAVPPADDRSEPPPMEHGHVPAATWLAWAAAGEEPSRDELPIGLSRPVRRDYARLVAVFRAAGYGAVAARFAGDVRLSGREAGAGA